MKIAAVVQRYGTEIVGGAETLCRGVAEGLTACDHEVEVWTTCARSYRTWANAYAEAVEKINGVVVRRFRVDRERNMEEFNAMSASLFGRPHDGEDERAWLEAQGPLSPQLLHHIHTLSGDFDRLLFFTYLYYPTVHGIHVAPGKSVLVPTAHDEAPIYLQIYESVFTKPAGIIFNTQGEADFTRQRFPRLTTNHKVIGVGIDRLEELGSGAAGPDGHAAATVAPGKETPMLLYAGRIEPGKGVDQMLEYLIRMRDESGRKFSVCLIGEVAMDLPPRDWIEVLGYVSEDEKIRRFRDATVLLAPSALESFGIVVLEAMAAGTPALVNAASDAAIEHCRNGDGGLYYGGYPEFKEALGLLLDDPELRATLATKGASYVRENYSWPRIIERYENFLAAI